MAVRRIVTFATDVSTTPQISMAAEGGSGTPVPDISIEVDNLEEVYQHAIAAACLGLTRFGGHPEAFSRGVPYGQNPPPVFT